LQYPRVVPKTLFRFLDFHVIPLSMNLR